MAWLTKNQHFCTIRVHDMCLAFLLVEKVGQNVFLVPYLVPARFQSRPIAYMGTYTWFLVNRLKILTEQEIPDQDMLK